MPIFLQRATHARISLQISEKPEVQSVKAIDRLTQNVYAS
jgi:hypothetical protein